MYIGLQECGDLPLHALREPLPDWDVRVGPDNMVAAFSPVVNVESCESFPLYVDSDERTTKDFAMKSWREHMVASINVPCSSHGAETALKGFVCSNFHCIVGKGNRAAPNDVFKLEVNTRAVKAPSLTSPLFWKYMYG